MEVEDRTLLFTTRTQQRKVDEKGEAVLNLIAFLPTLKRSTAKEYRNKEWRKDCAA